MYFVKFEQGRFFLVSARSGNQALAIVIALYPELEHADVLSVDEVINGVFEI